MGTLVLCLMLIGQTPEQLRTYVTEMPTSRVSSNNSSTTEYLRAQLKGYEAELQPFGNTANVLATKIGPLDTVLVVGAHYDAVPGSPGADDNASGTAVVLMLAQMLKDQTTRHTISFQLYSGEEDGLLGSHYYCENPKWPIKKHLFMLNLDMIGYLRPVTGDETVPVNDILRPLFAKYEFAQGITLRNDPGSDNDSFEKKGIPAIFLHTGLHKNYHRRTDTADKLNYKGMSEICKYAYDLLLTVDKFDTPKYDIRNGLPTIYTR